MEDFKMYSKIQQAKNQGFSKNATASNLDLNWRTVDAYWDMTPEEYAQKRQSMYNSGIDEYQNVVLQWLYEYEDISAAQIKDWLQEHYDEVFKDRTVRRFVLSLRQAHDLLRVKGKREFEAVPEMPPGKQLQADFGFYNAQRLSGARIKLFFVIFILAHSRYKYVVWQTKHFNSRDFVVALEACMQHIGGRPQQLVIDQDRLMVVKENAGDIIFTDEFERCKTRHNLDVYVCRKHDPQSKGMVESGVKFVKYNFARNRTFINLEQWELDSQAWLVRTGNGKVHEETKKIPAEMLLDEKPHLQPVIITTSLEPCTDMVTTPVLKNNTIRYRGNKYSVPKGSFIEHAKVLVKEDSGMLFICSVDGEIILTSPVASGRGELITNRHHQRDISESVSSLVEEVVELLGGTTQARQFIDRIKKAKRRYIRDQLTIIRTAAIKYSSDIIKKAMQDCHDCQTDSAVDFRDFAINWSRQMTIEEYEEITIINKPLVEKPLHVIEFPGVKQHSPDIYQKILEKGDA